MIEIRPDMLELLESFGKTVHKGQKAANARSLAQLKKNAKKRTYKEALGDGQHRDGGNAGNFKAKRFKKIEPNNSF